MSGSARGRKGIGRRTLDFGRGKVESTSLHSGGTQLDGKRVEESDADSDGVAERSVRGKAKTGKSQ